MAAEPDFSAAAPVEAVDLRSGALAARVLSVGAAIQDLRLDGHDAPLVIGFEDPEHYRDNPLYLGVVAGRYANRIRDGRFRIDGETFQGPRNFLGKHALHGGRNGHALRHWHVEGQGADWVTLALGDPDGTEGFPGTLDVRCTYRLEAPATLSVLIEAATDRPTLCNLAQHSYFNLEDGGSTGALGHRLAIDADAYLPVDEELIPTGAIAPVEGTRFDFRQPRPLGGSGDYDHNFCLAPTRGTLRRAATVEAPRSGVRMELWTTEPGLQLYSGHLLESDRPGLGGRALRPRTGFCLEPQVWPDSPSQPGFPQAVLRPGELYRQRTEYRFSRSS